MGRLSDAFRKAFRSEIGIMGLPSFEEAPVTSMANRSNIVAQIKAARMSPERKARIEADLEKYPAKRELAYTIGDAEGLRAKTGAVLGTIAADIASDGMRNIWWFINAPQALANLVADQNVQRAGNEILGRQSPIIKNRATRMAATLPAVLATSVGVGNVMREEGYKAVLPSDEDPRQSSNAAAELGARYFLGRTGGLLPYDEFVKERPDVSREEYNNYKNYLFANKSPVKASLDGIHGPEVNFMGKSIPLLTGIAPVAAAIYGSRRGLKGAGKKLNEKYKNPGEKDAKSMVERADESHALLRQMQGRRKGYEAKLAEFEAGEAQERPTELVTQEMLNAASDQYNDDQRKVERQALEGALAGGALGAGGGMIGGLALESVIRSLKPQYTAEDSE